VIDRTASRSAGITPRRLSPLKSPSAATAGHPSSLVAGWVAFALWSRTWVRAIHVQTPCVTCVCTCAVNVSVCLCGTKSGDFFAHESASSCSSSSSSWMALGPLGADISHDDGRRCDTATPYRSFYCQSIGLMVGRHACGSWSSLILPVRGLHTYVHDVLGEVGWAAGREGQIARMGGDPAPASRL
jgi:hypothetical protein